MFSENGDYAFYENKVMSIQEFMLKANLFKDKPISRETISNLNSFFYDYDIFLMQTEKGKNNGTCRAYKGVLAHNKKTDFCMRKLDSIHKELVLRYNDDCRYDRPINIDLREWLTPDIVCKTSTEEWSLAWQEALNKKFARTFCRKELFVFTGTI